MRAPPARRPFAADNRAVSTIEFAVAFPLLLIFMLGGLQLVTFVNAVRKVELVASSVSEMISQATPPAGSSTATVNTQDIHFSWDSAMVIFPHLLPDAARQGMSWWQDITIDYASIKFTPNGNSCPGYDQSTCYTANVIWTSTGTTGTNYRPCGTAQLPTTSNVPSRYSLPSTVFSSQSIIAIDVVYTFTPTFGSKYFGQQRIARSVYIMPRYAQQINFNNTGSDGTISTC